MRFESFKGNQRVKEQLGILIESNRFPHALIIEGDEGLGKKTLAREIALALMCISDEERPCRSCAQCKKVLKGIHPDVLEYSPTDSGKTKTFKVDTVREIISDAAVKPNEAQYKVYILDECNTMRAEAQNAMLKLIEEPPGYAVFILCTTTKSALLETVLSRSVVISLEGVNAQEGAQYICENDENISFDDAFRAMSVWNGNIGKAIDSLGDSKLAKISSIANELALALTEDKEYELIKACSVFERDNQTMIASLSYLKAILRDALLYESGSDMVSGNKETARKLAVCLTKTKLLKLIEVCDKVGFAAQGNGNNAILITKLCYELRRAQNR